MDFCLVVMIMALLFYVELPDPGCQSRSCLWVEKLHAKQVHIPYKLCQPLCCSSHIMLACYKCITLGNGYALLYGTRLAAT